MEHIKEDMEKLKKQIEEFNEKYDVNVDIYYIDSRTLNLVTRLRV